MSCSSLNVAQSPAELAQFREKRALLGGIGLRLEVCSAVLTSLTLRSQFSALNLPVQSLSLGCFGIPNFGPLSLSKKHLPFLIQASLSLWNLHLYRTRQIRKKLFYGSPNLFTILVWKEEEGKNGNATDAGTAALSRG